MRLQLRGLPLAVMQLLALSIVSACSAPPTARNDDREKSQSAQAKAAASRDKSKSATFLSSPDFVWLQESIQNTGNPVVAAEYPWQVGIQVRFGSQNWRCGGTLISASFILTAAHCLDGAAASDLSGAIRIGLDDISVFHGSDKFGQGAKLVLDRKWPVTFHPQWKKAGQAFAWDAALLKLAASLPVISAPASSVAMKEGIAVTSGWGDYDASDRPSVLLRAVAVPVVTNDICRAALPAERRAAVGSATLCAVSKVDDACARDSGGPLVVGPAFRPQLIGIVSWGLAGSCGAPGPAGLLVGAYTRVSEVAPWITQATNDPSTVSDRPLGPVFSVRPQNDM